MLEAIKSPETALQRFPKGVTELAHPRRMWEEPWLQGPAWLLGEPSSCLETHPHVSSQLLWGSASALQSCFQETFITRGGGDAERAGWNINEELHDRGASWSWSFDSVLPRFPVSVPSRRETGNKKTSAVKWEARILRGSQWLALSLARRLGESGIPGPASFPPGLGFPICRMGF